MIEHDNLEEFNDPANYDLEEAERSVPRIQFLQTWLANPVGPSWRSPAVPDW